MAQYHENLKIVSSTDMRMFGRMWKWLRHKDENKIDLSTAPPPIPHEDNSLTSYPTPGENPIDISDDDDPGDSFQYKSTEADCNDSQSTSQITYQSNLQLSHSRLPQVSIQICFCRCTPSPAKDGTVSLDNVHVSVKQDPDSTSPHTKQVETREYVRSERSTPYNLRRRKDISYATPSTRKMKQFTRPKDSLDDFSETPEADI